MAEVALQLMRQHAAFGRSCPVRVAQPCPEATAAAARDRSSTGRALWRIAHEGSGVMNAANHIPYVNAGSYAHEGVTKIGGGPTDG